MRVLINLLNETIPLLAILAACFLVVMVPIYFFTKAACYAQTEGFESRFGILTDCQVQVNDRWLQWDNYRATEEAEGKQ